MTIGCKDELISWSLSLSLPFILPDGYRMQGEGRKGIFDRSLVFLVTILPFGLVYCVSIPLYKDLFMRVAVDSHTNI